MTSSPPSSGLSPAVPSESPALPVGNRQQGLRSLRDLTQHFTARADDSHAAPVNMPRREAVSLQPSCLCQALVRFLAYYRIKPHAPPLVRAPVNSFEFHPCEHTPQAVHLTRLLRHWGSSSPTPSAHRLQRGLPGYLILFAPHAFAPQRQSMARSSPSPPVFFLISTDFTPTPGIPAPPPKLKQYSFQRVSPVEPEDFTPDLYCRLRALYAQ